VSVAIDHLIMLGKAVEESEYVRESR